MVPGRLVELVTDVEGENRRGNDLGMGMLDRGSRPQTVVLQNDDQSDPRIILEGQEPLPLRPQHLLHLPVAHQWHTKVMARALADNLVSPNAVRLPKKPFFWLPFQAPLGNEGGE